MKSQTSAPYQIELPDGKSILDMPGKFLLSYHFTSLLLGYSDSQGFYKELVNAFYSHELNSRLNFAMFIYVTSHHAIQGTGEMLIQNLITFAQGYDDVSFLEGKISMCVT